MKISGDDKAIIKEIRRRVRIAEGELSDLNKQISKDYYHYAHPDEITLLIGGNWKSRLHIHNELLRLYRDLNKMLDGVED